jgi:hypothetical protein
LPDHDKKADTPCITSRLSDIYSGSLYKSRRRERELQKYQKFIPARIIIIPASFPQHLSHFRINPAASFPHHFRTKIPVSTVKGAGIKPCRCSCTCRRLM